MNVFGYARVSGKSQVEGDGFPRQEADIAAFCSAHSLHMLEVFREQAVSGTVEGIARPTFADMLHRIDRAAPVVGAVVVERVDRLARDLMVNEVILKELRERGVKLFSVDQGQLIDMASNGGDPTRVLIRQIMGALAQWDKSMIVKKLRAAKDRKKAAGLLKEGNSSYGELPGEKHILNFLIASRDMNYTQLAKFLNSGGSFNRRGDPWTPQNVRTVILNHRKKNP